MDSELSLIEISGADDSLLLQPIPIPSDDGDTGAASLDKNYFPCSPLQLLDGSAPSVSSGVVDKENIGVNKFETPNLGVDSLQRKRKNERCGYNLRKSLAWNRAFLTEEGVLDPSELSIISGNASDVMSDKLAVIHEDDKELSHENSVSYSGSENLPAFEEKLFQKLPRIGENEGQSASRSSTKTRLTTAKPTRIPVSSVKRRVLAAQDVNSSRSKQSSGHFVTASSSLKRAASSNITNVGCKDLKKVSKARTANPDLGRQSSTINTMPSSGYSKQTQRVKPDIPAGRNVRMKGLSGNAAGPQRNVTGSIPAGKPLTAKSTTRQASGNMANPQSRTDPMPVKNMLKPPIKPSSRNEVGSASKGVSLVEKAELIEGKIQHLQVQRAEPTGLRMPSPSISFFDQPRASALRRPIINAQSCNALPPVSSNMKAPQRIGSADTTMLAPVQKMMLTPDIKSESNAKWINSNAKTSVGCSPIPRQREDSNDACYNLKSLLQVDVEESSILPKFLCLQKQACKNLREDINQLVCDVHLKDENATEGSNATGCIGTVTDAQAREECTDDDREVHPSQNNSSLGACNQTVENQSPERYDQTAGGLSSPCGRTDVLIPIHLCGCEDDGLDGLQKTGRRLDSEDNVNGSSSSSLKVEIGMASLAGNHCLIIADDVNGGATEQLKDSSSNSEQPFNVTSSSDDLLKGSIGHEIPSEPAPASTDGGVIGGPNSFSVSSHMTSDKPGSLDSPQLEEDELATSHSMASGDGTANEKGKDEINLLKAGDIFDSITMTIHEESIDVRADHIGTPQSISEPALSKEGAEDHQLTLTERCFVASLLQSIDGSINSDQIALPVQVDSSHLVGVHLDSSDMINAGSYVESQLELAFDELDASAPADGNVIVATNCVETESETKIEMLDSATIDDNLSCEKRKDEINILKAGDILGSIATTIHAEPIDVSVGHITPQSISEPALSKEVAEEHQLTLTECCSVASLLQSFDGSINSDQIALPVQVDSSHVVGVHLDSSDKINAGLYVENHLERAFDELDTSAPADGNVAVASNICVETESETKIEMMDSATIDDNLSCEKRSLNSPDRVTFDEHALVSVEYEALDCSHWLGNQQTSSPNMMLPDKHANEESPVETELNKEKNSLSLVSNLEMNDEDILVALGAPSLQAPEIGSASHGSENRIEIPVAVSHLAHSMREAEDTDDDLTTRLSVDAPLQPLVGRTSYNQSSSPVREESHRDNLTDPSIGGDKIIVGSNLESHNSASPEDVEAHIYFASDIVHQETESGIKTGDANDSIAPTDDLGKDQKPDHVVGKPPADAIPYSDEWLAAIEAAGEDILKMKSGAVQNSPPERSEPEPSPWSPVRRKNNQAIGPFDCTKFVDASVPPNTP